MLYLASFSPRYLAKEEKYLTKWGYDFKNFEPTNPAAKSSNKEFFLAVKFDHEKLHIINGKTRQKALQF